MHNDNVARHTSSDLFFSSLPSSRFLGTRVRVVRTMSNKIEFSNTRNYFVNGGSCWNSARPTVDWQARFSQTAAAAVTELTTSTFGSLFDIVRRLQSKVRSTFHRHSRTYFLAADVNHRPVWQLVVRKDLLLPSDMCTWPTVVCQSMGAT